MAWALFTVAVTVVVDPYRMYDTPPIGGLTRLKPRIYQQAELAKTYQLERVAPRTLLLGSSRVEVGIDPESPVWPAASQPVFNAAMAGRGVPTALAMLRDDIAVRPPETVILGIDFQDFLTRQDPADEPLPPMDAEDRRLLVDRDGKPNRAREVQLWQDRLATTLTIDAFTDSVLTLFDQDDRTTATMTRRGFNPLHEYRLFVQRDGYRALFDAKAADYQRQYSHFPIPDFSHPPRLANFRDLQTILALANAHGIRTILFIHPCHADYLEMLHRLGLWPSFENWERALVGIVGDMGARVQLYDFAEYDAFTTERVPAQGDRMDKMRWYWEPGHYKKALGDQIVGTVIRGHAGFGRVLSPDNVEAAIADVREQRDRYLSRREAEVARGRP